MPLGMPSTGAHLASARGRTGGGGGGGGGGIVPTAPGATPITPGSAPIAAGPTPASPAPISRAPSSPSSSPSGGFTGPPSTRDAYMEQARISGTEAPAPGSPLSPNVSYSDGSTGVATGVQPFPVTQQEQIQQIRNWLENQSGIVSDRYTGMRNTLNADSALSAAVLGRTREHLGDTYGTDSGLLAANRYADVDLARERLGLDYDRLGLERDRLGLQRTALDDGWGADRGYIEDQQGFAKRLHFIQQWLNARNKGHTTADRDLAFRRADHDWQRDSRHRASQATARGAYTSRMHRLDQRDLSTDRDLTRTGAQNVYQRSWDGLTAEGQFNNLTRDQTLRALLHQLQRGQIDYDRDSGMLGLEGRGLDIDERGLGVQGRDIDNRGTIYDLRGQQLTDTYNYGLDMNKYEQTRNFIQALVQQGHLSEQEAQAHMILAQQAMQREGMVGWG